jgi:hypothetical protein
MLKATVRSNVGGIARIEVADDSNPYDSNCGNNRHTFAS